MHLHPVLGFVADRLEAKDLSAAFAIDNPVGVTTPVFV